MPQAAWNKKRERQYEHIKEGLEERAERGHGQRDRGPHREQGAGPGRRGPPGQPHLGRRHLVGPPRAGCARTRAPGGRTRDQLYNEARQQNIKGRSKMNKAQLEKAVGR